MAYLHCHGKGCHWEQDDFWEQDDPYWPKSEGYSPFRSDLIDSMKEDIFKDRIYLDRSRFEECEMDYNEDENGCWIKGTDYVAYELERKARRIRNMKVRTNEEWKKVKDTWVCPKCGSKEWDID